MGRTGQAPYIVLLGATGVTTRIALQDDHVGANGALGAGRLSPVRDRARNHEGRTLPEWVGGFWAAVAAFCAAGALVLFFYALTKGEASTVVPVTSVYPLVTLVGAAIFLGEN